MVYIFLPYSAAKKTKGNTKKTKDRQKTNTNRRQKLKNSKYMHVDDQIFSIEYSGIKTHKIHKRYSY